MDKRAEQTLYDFENRSLGLDDTFQFKCKACGKCCNDRHDILLTSRDLYNIAHELGRTPEYIIERYCDVYVGESSRIPIVRLRPTGPKESCPLLRDKRCIVHKAKPVVCALFPLGRGTMLKPAENGVENPKSLTPIYFLQDIPCGTRDQTHTVRSWLEQFGLPVEDEFYELWTETTAKLGELFRSLEKRKVTEGTMHLLWSAAYSELYLNYNTDAEFMPQYRANMTKLTGVLAEIMTEAEKFFGGVSDGQ
jgi:Fe-S-cluster containining protein